MSTRVRRTCQERGASPPRPRPRRRAPSLVEAHLAPGLPNELRARLPAEVDRRELPHLGGPLGDGRTCQVIVEQFDHVLTHRQALAIGPAPQPLAERDGYAANL